MTEQAAATPKAKKETVVTPVTMQDGTIVEFTGKRKLLKSSEIKEDGSLCVRLDFRNGEVRWFTIPQDLLPQFALHGAEQKLGDEIAGLKGVNGAEADIDDCVLAMDNLIERLYRGEWATKRDSDGMAGTSVLVRALVELYGKSVADIKAFLATKSQAEKMALRAHPRIKPIVDRIEAEKASKAPAVDTESLLAGLDA